MRNAARPKVRAQIHPRALEIIDPLYHIPEGYTDYGAPKFTGVPQEVWNRLVSERPKHFQELLDILHYDYPTFAALCQKIWAKKIGRLMPFVFNITQLLVWNRISYRIAHKLTIFLAVLKARQLGISTLVNGWIHWHVWRLRDIEALMVVDEKDLAESFIDRLRIFHEELPEVAGISRTLRKADKDARVPKDELYYRETRSKASTSIAKTTETHGRSTIHNHLAEYAFYPNAEKLQGALMPQLPPAGSPARLECSFIVESTPNGKNDFYALWLMAKREPEWEAVFLPWYVCEDEYYLTPPQGWKMDAEQTKWAHNLAHLRKQIDGIGSISPGQVYWYERTLAVECGGNQDMMDALYPSDDETCFLLQSRSIFKFEMRYLAQCVIEAAKRAPAEFARRNIVCTKNFLRGFLEYSLPPNPFGSKPMTIEQLKLKPKFIESPDGPLVLWSPPQLNHDYVIGMDAASGLMDSDNSVLQLIDVHEGRQVGEYAAKASPEQLADDGVALGWFYNTAMLYPEINSIGVVTMKRIKQVWQYPRLGREEKWDEIGVKANKYGHFTTHDQKKIMVSFLVYLVRNHFLAIASDALLSEMSTFVMNKTEAGEESFEADANNADDRVMALMLACYVIRQSPKLLIKMTQDRKPPTAIDELIHDAPSLSDHKFDQLPDIVKERLGKMEPGLMPANPIRGLGELELL